jgi:hypothetical protein
VGKNSIRLLSDINPEDVLADDLAAIRVDDFQVIVKRGGDVNGIKRRSIEVCVNNNGIPFHIKSIVLDEDDVIVMHFVEGE